MSWATDRLGSVAEVVTGSTPSKKKNEYYGNEVPFITPAELDKFELGVPNVYLSKEGSKQARVLPPESVLVCCIGSLGKIGYTTKEVATNQQINALVFDNTKVHPRFGFHFCKTLKPLMKHLAPSTTVPIINKSMFSNFQIPIPPLPEQKRIAAILDKADGLRRKREAAIKLTDDLLRATFLDMFGDPVSKEWELTTVENIAENKKGSIRTGPFGSQLLHSEFTETGIAVLGIDNAVKNKFRWAKQRFISENKYEEMKRYTVKPRDLLITIMGTCGRTAIVPNDCPIAINTKHLCCITLDSNKCTSEFLHSYFLMHPVSKKYLSRLAKGAVMDGLNMGIIKELPVYLPPLDIQKRYSDICTKITRNVYKLQNSEASTNNLFSSLTQQAFLY